MSDSRLLNLVNKPKQRSKYRTGINIIKIDDDNGCLYWSNCFTCILPTCILDEPIRIQLKKIKQYKSTHGNKKVKIVDDVYDVDWDFELVDVLSRSMEPEMVKSYLENWNSDAQNGQN